MTNESGGNEKDTTWTGFVVCPYCFVEYTDSDEFFDGVNDDTVVDCECGKRFYATRHISVDYSTYKEKAL